MAESERLLGAAAGRQPYEHAQAHDPRTVVPHALPKTTTVSHGFDHDELDPDEHHRAVLGRSGGRSFRQQRPPRPPSLKRS
ncbi:hypothetical protein ACFY2M_38500 [Streptomyces sp. NPDC001276]|uniref:hypothetical protein n=1 Tax=Streptomyces sp. NPDC001276 TaxID=3364555 RepID=UPI0036BFEFD7